jgi:hypothetical protein
VEYLRATGKRAAIDAVSRAAAAAAGASGIFCSHSVGGRFRFDSSIARGIDWIRITVNFLFFFILSGLKLLSFRTTPWLDS